MQETLQNIQIFISKIHSNYFGSEQVWKCYRCNLTFPDEDLASIHKVVSNHSVTKA